jgi:hypothetical protein
VPSFFLQLKGRDLLENLFSARPVSFLDQFAARFIQLEDATRQP